MTRDPQNMCYNYDPVRGNINLPVSEKSHLSDFAPLPPGASYNVLLLDSAFPPYNPYPIPQLSVPQEAGGLIFGSPSVC